MAKGSSSGRELKVVLRSPASGIELERATG